MRTALENSPTKEKLLEAAQELILAKGFVGTTVDDICKAAKVTKGSFFHYFDSKDELGCELLTKYCSSTKEAFLSGCCQKEKDPLKRIYGFLDFMIGMAEKKEGGCLLGSMAQELSDTHPEIRSICSKAFAEMVPFLKKDFADAKTLYAPKTAIDPEGLVEHFIAVAQGSMLIAKVRQDGGSNANGFKHYKNYVKALFGR